MKLKKILSFLLIFILLFSLFLIPSEAAVVTVPQYYVDVSEMVSSNSVVFPTKNVVVDPFNSSNENCFALREFSNYVTHSNIVIDTFFHLYSKSDDYLIRNNGVSSVCFSGVPIVGLFRYDTSELWQTRSYLITVAVHYANGNREVFESSEVITEFSNRLHSFTFSFVPSDNVTDIYYYCSATYSFATSGYLSYEGCLGEFDDPDSSFTLSVNQDFSSGDDSSSDDTLLEKILSSISNAFKSFWSHFDNLTNWFKSVFDSISNGFKGLWSYLDSIYDKINSVVSVISNGLIWEIRNSFKGLWDYFDDFYSFLISLPDKILNGILDIFIPDVETLQADLEAAVENITSQFGIHFDTYDRLFDTEIAPEDVVEDYNIPGIGTFKLKFLDTSYLIKGVAFFRPFIRGFLVLLLFFYNWKQVLTLFDQNPAIAGGAIQGLASHQQSTQIKIDL